MLAFSDKRDESRDFLCRPGAQGLLSQRTERMEKKKKEEKVGGWRRKWFCCSFSPLNLHLFHPSLPFPRWIYISFSQHLSLGKVGFEDEKDPICWQMTDWLNIYKMGSYWVLILHGTKEIKEKEKEMCISCLWAVSFHFSWTNDRGTNRGRLTKNNSLLSGVSRLVWSYFLPGNIRNNLLHSSSSSLFFTNQDSDTQSQTADRHS